MKHYVVTLYVSAENRDAVDNIMAAAAMAGKVMAPGVDVKNWIIDDDETPDQHP